MQFTTASALILASAGAVSAAAVPRQATPQTQTNLFNITSLAFSGTPHSVIANYALNVTKSDGSTGSSVLCSTTTNTSPSITSFNSTGCQDPSWSFSFLPQNTSQGTGYSLSVTRLPSEGAANNETGCTWISSDDIVYWQNPGGPTGNVYQLNYGPDFQMTYNDNGMPCVWA